VTLLFGMSAIVKLQCAYGFVVYIGFKVLAVVVMKNTVFWDIMYILLKMN
jgi:hypothetical protein